MSVWIAGATVGVGVGGMIMADKASGDAATAQSDATATTARLEEEKLDFAYEQYDEQLARYDEWQAIYGPIEENLGEFYNQLTPETYTAAGLEYNQEAFQKTKTQTFETLAQRGLDSSGITAAIDSKLGVEKAKMDATTRRDAPFRVAQEKTGFLSQGKGGPTYAPQGTVGNVMASNQMPNALQNEANIASANASSLWGSAGNMLSTGVNYFAKNRAPTANTGTVKTDYNPTQTPYMPAFGGADR